MQKPFKILFVILIVNLIVCSLLFANCAYTQRAGDESLVESRIIAAVNAERNRWIAELGQKLRDGLGEVDRRVDSVESGLQQIAVAAREYREFVLSIIDGLQYPESGGSDEGQHSSGGLSGGNSDVVP